MNAILLHLAASLFAADVTPPKILDDRLQLQLVAANPDIVTPTGIAVDDRGRVLVIESHTHFPPQNYAGPKGDRILLMDEFDPATGKVGRIRTFFEGTTHTMSLAVYRDGSVFVATRAEIFRLRDADDDGKAEERTPICRLETAGNYPHNGLSGFAFDFAGNVYFGFGENLGADYKLIGSDGKELKGGGEGGNIYVCDPKGQNIRRLATGFWNPFHLCFDAFGRLFAVDNDPDSRPPCRLLHIVEGGDYGYRFRNGRKGVHPFTAWNGELPGTLPMVAGTGEAPSGILAYESDNLPKDYIGDLLVTSWGDHRLERYRLSPRGASFSAEMTPVLRGDQNFRPVGIALAPDGSLYFSDWVDKSYQLHGKGRVWRLSAKNPPKPDRQADPVAALSSPHGPWREAAARKLTREQAVGAVNASSSERARSLAARAAFWANDKWRVAASQSTSNGDSSAPAPLLSRLEAFTEGIARFRSDEFRQAAEAGEQLSTLLAGGPGADGEAAQAKLQEWNPLRYLKRNQPMELRLATLGVFAVDSELGDAINDPFIQAALVAHESRNLQHLRGDELTHEVGPILRAIFKLPPPQSKLSSLRQSLQAVGGKQAANGRILAVALRQVDNQTLRPLAADLLESSDEEQRLVGILWVGESRLAEHRQVLEAVLKDPAQSRQVFECALAALDLLDGNRPIDPKAESAGEEYVLRLLKDGKTPTATRRFALRTVRPDHPQLTTEFLTTLLGDAEPAIRLEAIRTIRQRPDADRWPQLRSIAANEGLTVQERCEAILGLSPGNKDDRKLLLELAGAENTDVASEALRALRGFDLTPEESQLLTALAAGLADARKELAERVIQRNPPKNLPKPEDQAAWLKLAEGEGDAAAGERIFFHLRVGGCFRCHEHEGRGYQIGPDLSTIGRSLTRERLVQSIVDPSREIAPQFTNWSILTVDGEVKTGIHIGDEVDGRMKYADQNGRVFHVHPDQVDQRKLSSQSIMPNGLADNLTAQELRDLLAFLIKAQ